MARDKFKKQRMVFATALRSMGSILFRQGICTDISPLQTAANQASQSSGKNADWNYDICDLRFILLPNRHIYPSSATNFNIVLSLNLAGLFNATNSADQFTVMKINVEKYAFGKQGAELKSAWHLDRHKIDPANNGPYITDDIHPFYHFQFGGKNMKNIYDKLGKTFLVDSPRLMHPPMDGILAIDFILSNYAGKVWKNLREDGQYANLVDTRLKELWEPYFSSISNSWQNPRGPFSKFLCPSVKL